MERLPFTLPDFFRISWASRASRVRWEPVVDSLRGFWERMEIRSVQVDQRKAAIIRVPMGSLEEYAARLDSYGLATKLVGPRLPEEAFDVCGRQIFQVVSIGRGNAAADAREAYQDNADAALGELLGYPPCCVEFFKAFWSDNRFLDSTWSMAAATHSAALVGDREYEISGASSANVLLRRLGIRPVFHLPCGFDCEATDRLAEELRVVGRGCGETDAVKLLGEVLRWPMQWSALHGIAEVETPVFRISMRTDATASLYKVRLVSDAASIDLAPRGNRHPFQQQFSPRTKDEKKIAIKGSSNRLSDVISEPWYHGDNGFRSIVEMERAFQPIIELIQACEPNILLHLACKNGALLEMASRCNRELKLYGVDGDSEKIRRAKKFLPPGRTRVWCDEFHYESSLLQTPVGSTAIIMIGRLLEIPRRHVDLVLDNLFRQCTHLVIYAFDDWLRKGSLRDLAASVGLALNDICGMRSAAARVTGRQ